jgi:hypothetical protein
MTSLGQRGLLVSSAQADDSAPDISLATASEPTTASSGNAFKILVVFNIMVHSANSNQKTMRATVKAKRFYQAGGFTTKNRKNTKGKQQKGTFVFTAPMALSFGNGKARLPPILPSCSSCTSW